MRGDSGDVEDGARHKNRGAGTVLQALAAVIDESAEIAGFYQGREPVEAVLRMLEGDSSVPSRGSEI